MSQKSYKLEKLFKTVGELTKNSSAFLRFLFTEDKTSKNKMHLQSADVADDELDHTEVKYQHESVSEVLTFVDSSTGLIDSVGSSVSTIANASASQGTDMQGFLSRPTLIDSRTWTTATANGVLGSSIEPWYQLLNSSVIVNKLKNYAFLRGNLCIKIVINATPFHFGLMRVAYEPSVNAANTGDRTSKIRTNPTSSNPLIVPYSQLPGAWVYPADNSGGEIRVPFFKFNQWLQLNSAAAAKTLGTLTYFVTAPLQVASATGSTSITIDTFAWLEDVVLSGSTAELTLQAKDEYDGVISKPASAIADVASKLDQIPYIGKFARATKIGASAIAEVASMFGFTNVPNISDVNGFCPMPHPHLATSDISVPIQKLSLDPKQELSIDPTLHGLDSVDEMNIRHIVEKKSALAVTSWATTDAVGTVIFNANPSPVLFNGVSLLNTVPATAGYRIYHTPMSYIAMLFQHWRGDIIFEIDVLCTKFHKGRLKISWDPLGSGGATALTENTVYTAILDIGESNKASFRVPFHQMYEFVRCRGVSRTNWTPGNALPCDGDYDNGLFMISVLTPLMSPVTPQTVNILISVKGAENLEFANPRSFLGENSSSQPPSFFALQGKDVADVASKEFTLGDSGTKHPHRYDLNFGERIVSLRTLLHRFSLYDINAPSASTATKVALYAKSYSRLPPCYGYDPNGKHTATKIIAAAGTAPFNISATHPITYVAGMYGGYRGSVNYVANFSNDLTPYIGDVRIQRITDSSMSADSRMRSPFGANVGVANGTVNYGLLMSHGTTSHFSGGSALTNTQTNGTLSWNQPHLNGSNFHFPDPTYSITGNSTDKSSLECSYMQLTVKQTAATQSSEYLSVVSYAASGPDFHCLWWLCCPTLDYAVSTPTVT